MKFDNLKNILNDCDFNDNKILINKNLNEVIKFFKEKYYFDMLKSITAIDLGDGFELIYHLYSTENEEDLILSTKVHNEVESVTNLFESAKTDENEIYDMFGIIFSGNNNLKRLYMPEDWKGFPLRKDYIQDDTRLAWNDDKNEA